jgi:hypothetical protein
MATLAPAGSRLPAGYFHARRGRLLAMSELALLTTITLSFFALLIARQLLIFKLPSRFSLRTLLIGMTVVAVALGLIFALSR